MGYLLRYLNWRKIAESVLAIDNPDEVGDDFAGILKTSYQVKEIPKGSNKGPEVSDYLQRARCRQLSRPAFLAKMS
jgi:hypothetical protein